MSYLIVGGGSAGNVLARRLLDAGETVTLLEAGGYDSNENIKHLNDLGKLWHSQDDWDYYTIPQAGAANRRMHVPRGKVMGGSHALNACIWVRGSRHDYDIWAYQGAEGWSWDEVLPYFIKIENYDGAPSQLRGTEGLLDVSATYERHDLQESMLEAAQQAGFPLNKDYNSGEVEGVSRIQLNLRDGHRFNTWHAYLKPVAEHPNLTILTSCRVVRLLIENKRVLGVVLLDETGTERELLADTTVLCAGALGSPEILLRSGIGPAEELKQVGIEPLVDSPQVGKNLQDHLLSPVIFTTEKPFDAPVSAPAQTHFFAKSSPQKFVADTQPLFFSNPMYSEAFPGGMSGPDQAFTLMAGIVRPVSRGSLTLSGPKLEDPVQLDLGALAEQEDADALVASLKHCREIGRQAALASDWGAKEIWPGAELVSDEDLEDYARGSVMTYHHQVGTCAMGLSQQNVVDSRTLAVRGVENLFVADASVMPLVPTGNTNAPTIMIAERAADLLLGK